MAFSWCENKPVGDASTRAYRGYFSARFWDNISPSFQNVTLGFRPVLIPLNPDTLEPNPSLLKGISDGQRIALASLYLDGKPVNLSKEKGVSYKKKAKILLGNRDKNKNNWLYVIKYKDLLWTDRNILVNLSWDDLQKQGYTD